MKYNCLIVDDEPLARKVIERHLQSFSQLTLQGSVESAKAAFELLHTQNIHLIFLDIQMPLVDGLQFIRSMKHPPAVIFTTAYTEYAAESYILDSIDYLIKPVSFERCERSINKFLKSIQPGTGGGKAVSSGEAGRQTEQSFFECNILCRSQERLSDDTYRYPCLR